MHKSKLLKQLHTASQTIKKRTTANKSKLSNLEQDILALKKNMD